MQNSEQVTNVLFFYVYLGNKSVLSFYLDIEPHYMTVVQQEELVGQGPQPLL